MKRIRHVSICLLPLLALLILILGTRAVTKAAKGSYLVYVGTYTGEKSKGIYAFRFDGTSGMLTPLGLAAETPTPSFLALHPTGQFLYAANEIGKYGSQKSGPVSAFAIDRVTGKLTFLNTVSSQGAGSCHLSVDKTGRNVLVANYGGGGVAVLPLDPHGQLREATAVVRHTGVGVDPTRQKGPHAHAIVPSPDNRFALVCDLGLDQVFVYRLDNATGSLTTNHPPGVKLKPGAGPRHLAFDPRGRFVYVINELQSSVTVFTYDATLGALTEVETRSTLPEGFAGENTGAEIQVHPGGKFLYCSNRGHNSIAVFRINRRNGTLTLVQHAETNGKEPRTFAIDPSGSYLLAANHHSDNIVIFRIDSHTGCLALTGQKVDIQAPVCIVFMPADRSPWGL